MGVFERLAHRTSFYYGWVVAAAVSITMMSSGTLAAPIFGIFIAPWTDEFGWSRTAISGAFSFGTVVAALVGPLVGPALDRYGGRLVLGAGALLMAASLVGLGFVGSLVGLYLVFSVGRAAMMSIQNLGSYTVIANWFVRRRAFATAVAINGSRIGLGFWPLVAAIVISTVGWREAFWVLGAGVGILAVVPLLLIVARRPEDVGLSLDGRAVSQSVDGTEVSLPLEHQWSTREAVRTGAFWFLMLAHMGAMVAGGGYGVHRIPLFYDRGMTEGWVGPVLVLHAVGMLVGGFVAAWLMDRVGQRVVIAMSMASAGGALIVALFVPANAPMAIFTFFESAAFGGVFAMLPVVYADYFGRESIGTIRGLTHPIVVGSNAVGPLYAGFLFDVSGGDYTWALSSFTGVLLLGATSALMARRPVPAVDTDTGGLDTPISKD